MPSLVGSLSREPNDTVLVIEPWTEVARKEVALPRFVSAFFQGNKIPPSTQEEGRGVMKGGQ